MHGTRDCCSICARGAQYDVIALVEASGWDARRRLHSLASVSVALDTFAFRRRAASLGYAHAHLSASASGFHVALLSTAPLALIAEGGPAFQRAVLVVDTHGVRWVVAHLHAHDPVARRAEAKMLAHLGWRYTSAWLPTVLLGDANSATPYDSACHDETGVATWLAQNNTPPFLRRKFTVPNIDPPRLDYRPLATLLRDPVGVTLPPWRQSSDGDNPLPGPYSDAVAPSGLQPGARAAGCSIGTVPTKFTVDPVGSPAAPPLRIDHALVNAPMAEIWRSASMTSPCHIASDDKAGLLSDHFPISCEWMPASAPPVTLQ